MVAFSAVIVGWALSLDYSAKLFTMTFVLVIMGSERASGVHSSCHGVLSWQCLRRDGGLLRGVLRGRRSAAWGSSDAATRMLTQPSGKLAQCASMTCSALDGQASRVLP